MESQSMQMTRSSKKAKYMIACNSMVLVIGVLLAKMIFGVTYATTFVMVIGLLGIILGCTYLPVHNQKWNSVRILLRRTLHVFMAFVLGTFIIIESLIFTSFTTDDIQNADYLVILGAGLKGDIPSRTLTTRLETGLQYLQNNPATTAIVSGGLDKGASITEAEAMKRYLVSHDIDENRIIKEDQSTSTKENLQFTKKVVDHAEQNRNTILIVTSDYHLFRAKHIACHYFSNVYGLSADTPALIMINYSIREYYAVMKMLLLSWLNV